MTETFKFHEFKQKVLNMTAEPRSSEGQEVINDGRSHVAEIWEDGEITSTKAGGLYGRRNLHQSSPPLLPDGYELFEVPEAKSHERRVIVDDELKGIIRNTTVEVTTIGVEFKHDPDRKYHVYEHRAEDEVSYVGSVRAQSQEEAEEMAHQEYGGPIEVKKR